MTNTNYIYLRDLKDKINFYLAKNDNLQKKENEDLIQLSLKLQKICDDYEFSLLSDDDKKIRLFKSDLCKIVNKIDMTIREMN